MTYNPNYDTNEQAPVFSATQLAKLRQEGITLTDKHYILHKYKDSAIPQSYLDDFQADMDAQREAGLKAIVRFAYNFNQSDLSDTNKERVLQHIAQLKPYLQRNADVIAFMEGGFIGKWGEWHGTENNLLGGDYRIDVNDNTREIHQALLDALPAKRMIAIRYVYQMQPLLNQTNCQQDTSYSYRFPQEIAFNGSTQARTGRHDDWFFGDGESNSGTWSDQEAARACQRAYLAEHSKYVPITTGETAVLTDYTKNNSPISELEQFHYASLSVNPDGSAAAPVAWWKENGVYEEMAKRLGYRLVLKQATMPTEVVAGEPLNMSFDVENVGFGSPYNPRKLEVILRHTRTRAIRRYDVTQANDNKLDPRFWFREDGTATKTVSVALGAIEPGSYEILLNLPDPEPALYRRAEFSIRLANQDTWEAETGFNKLNATVTITAGETATGQPVDGVYEIRSVNAPERVLTAAAIQGNGDNVYMSTDADLSKQRWQITRLENGYYRLSPTTWLAMCLDVRRSQQTNNTNTQTWWANPSGQANQEWKVVLEDEANDYYSFSPRHTEEAGLDMRLDASGKSVEDRTNVQLLSASSTPDQVFVLEAVDASNARSMQAPEQRTTELTHQTRAVYPNPMTDRILTVEAVSTESVIRLYDSQGRSVLFTQKQLGEHRVELRIQGKLAKGIYVLDVRGPQGRHQREKIVVQ